MVDNDLTLEQFREEMQHRVVKYPLNSRPVFWTIRHIGATGSAW